MIPNGVNLQHYVPVPPRDWRTRRERDAADPRFVVAYFGRLSEEKAPDTFLEIAARLAHRADLDFLICGTGPMRAALRYDATLRGLDQRLHFLGFVNSREYLPCSDVVIVCSRMDGRPNIVMESLAMGVPVIASRVGGIPRMAPEGQGTVLCEPGDVNGFCRSTVALADDRKRHRELAAAGRRRAEEHFSSLGSGERYAELFRELARKAGTARPPSRATPAVTVRRAQVRPAGDFQTRKLAGAFHSALRFLAPARLANTVQNAFLLCKLCRTTGGRRSLAEHFDAAYYVAANHDVAKARISPLFHYVFFGFAERRNPSRRFDADLYLEAHPGIARSGLNPLLHYLASHREHNSSGQAKYSG